MCVAPSHLLPLFLFLFLRMHRLEDAGYGVGHRVLELLAFRERQYKRETKLIGVLQFVSSTVWKALFNKVADSLERSTENEDEYMIHEREPITNAFVSAPADMSQLNCAAYIAGIISGVLNGASFVRGSGRVLFGFPFPSVTHTHPGSPTLFSSTPTHRSPPASPLTTWPSATDSATRRSF